MTKFRSKHVALLYIQTVLSYKDSCGKNDIYFTRSYH
jgi:hypothetical protein